MSLLFVLTDISPMGFDVLVAVNIIAGLVEVTQCSLADIYIYINISEDSVITRKNIWSYHVAT